MTPTEQAQAIRRRLDAGIRAAERQAIHDIMDLLDTGTINFSGVRKAMAIGDMRLHVMAQRTLGHRIPTRRTRIA